MTTHIQRSIFSILIASCTLWSTTAYPTFAEEIPNGYSVPNPGPEGGVWAGVGHENSGGGGPLNPFGEDFRANGFIWTDDLCNMDSDGDGRANGVELGDPDCVWMKGEKPDGPALSHPGFVDEALEEALTSTCADYNEPSVVFNFDVSFTQPTSMDATRTHYICEQTELEVPSAELLHNVKSSVIMDNSLVLHHMFVFICFDTSSDGMRVGEGPYECSGNESRCKRVAGWAIGPEETCLPPYLGEEYDFTGMTNVVVKVEAHYDNNSGAPQQDQSGIRVVFTPELRPISAATQFLGEMTFSADFEVPPQETAYPLSNICPTENTLLLDHPIYVYSFYPHMHLYGKTLYTEHYRCGQKIGELGRIASYEFDNQQRFNLPEVVKVLPGDALVTVCEFDTTTSEVPIVGGEETLDEMCLNSLGYYPAVEGMTACTSFDNGIAVERLEITGVSMEIAGSPMNMTGNSASAAIDLAAISNLATSSFAMGGGPLGPESFVFNYESDPTKNIAPCCAQNTCEQEYLVELGGICGLDEDCLGELVCNGGLCAEGEVVSPMTDAPADPTDPPASAAWDREIPHSLVITAVVIVSLFELL